MLTFNFQNAENALFEAIAAGNKVLSEKKTPFKIPVGESKYENLLVCKTNNHKSNRFRCLDH